MNLTEEQLKTIVMFLSMIVSIYEYIVSYFTKKKNEKKELVIERMKELCVLAEKLGSDGSKKKDYVLNGIKVYCENLKYKYDKDTWSIEIDSYIANTKKINYKQ